TCLVVVQHSLRVLSLLPENAIHNGVNAAIWQQRLLEARSEQCIYLVAVLLSLRRLCICDPLREDLGIVVRCWVDIEVWYTHAPDDAVHQRLIERKSAITEVALRCSLCSSLRIGQVRLERALSGSGFCISGTLCITCSLCSSIVLVLLDV